LEAHAILERALVRRAVERRTEADLVALAEALRSVCAARDDPDAFVAGDLALRAQIARSSRSRHLARTAESLRRRLIERQRATARSAVATGTAALAVDARRALVEAIATGDRAAGDDALDRLLLDLRAECSSPLTPV
jgi:DNA-binding FadR family transcriptional regulator